MSKASDFNNIGKIFEIQGQFKEAIKNYKQAIDLFNQLGQKQYVEFIQENIDKLREKSID